MFYSYLNINVRMIQTTAMPKMTKKAHNTSITNKITSGLYLNIENNICRGLDETSPQNMQHINWFELPKWGYLINFRKHSQRQITKTNI